MQANVLQLKRITTSVAAPDNTPAFATVGGVLFRCSYMQLEPVSQNGITGSWSPSTIDNVTVGTTTYYYTDANQCATAQTLTVNVTAQRYYSGICCD
ncbi:MAG: hypothetical protein IPN80_01230 [Flavobacterium sp.]|nr:hypothetical protein [Flavobacterium sp.]